MILTLVKAFLSPLRVFVAALLLASSLQAHASDGDTTVAGEILVKLRTTAALAPLLAKYQLSVIDQFGSRPIYRLMVPSSMSTKDTIALLTLEVDVLIAEPNVVHRSPEARKNTVWTIGTPQMYAAQWAPGAMRLNEARALSTGAGVRVAVLDTGIDRAHPLFTGRLLPGFDFVDYDNDPSEVGDVDAVGFGHGTHVAGLITMVAPDAKIMPLGVLDSQGEGNAWVLAEAILYAIDPDGNPSTDDGAQIINLSLGTLARTRILDTVAQLATCTVPDNNDTANDLSDPGYDDDEARCSRSRGVVIIAAAGNDGSDQVREYPAAEGAHGLLAVGASTNNSRLAKFSNFGSWIGVAAPGDGITSSIPGGGYATWSGTSMATPLVAGTAALVRARNSSMKPDDVIKRIASRSALLCGSQLHQLDAAAALYDKPPPTTICTP